MYTFFISIFYVNEIFANEIKINDIIPTTDRNIVKDTSLLSVLSSFKAILFTIVWVVAVAMFLYSWVQVLMSFWKPDEFKKALKTFWFTILWLIIVSLAYALVSIISGINI